jgi:hypothetical protein
MTDKKITCTQCKSADATMVCLVSRAYLCAKCDSLSNASKKHHRYAVADQTSYIDFTQKPVPGESDIRRNWKSRSTFITAASLPLKTLYETWKYVRGTAFEIRGYMFPSRSRMIV